MSYVCRWFDNLLLEDLSGINMEENVSNELTKVNSWLLLSELSLNTDATKYIAFHIW